MSRSKGFRASVIIAGRLALAAGGALVLNRSASAGDFTAEKVMKEMKPDERFAYISGTVEGLAVARFFKDGKKPDGMNCIYGWFYDDKKTIETVYTAFDRYPTYPPGSIIYNLAKYKCGE